MNKTIRRIGLRTASNKTKPLNSTIDWTTSECTVQKVDMFRYLGKYITKAEK